MWNGYKKINAGDENIYSNKKRICYQNNLNLEKRLKRSHITFTNFTNRFRYYLDLYFRITFFRYFPYFSSRHTDTQRLSV